MLRLGLLSFGAVLLCVSGAQAHSVHGDCRAGDSWMGVVPHFHPGGYGKAAPCGGGGGERRRGSGYDGGNYEPPSPGYGRGYQPPPANPGGYYGGGPHRSGDGYRHPQGTILGHGEAAGCAPSFSRVVQGGGSVCREVP